MLNKKYQERYDRFAEEATALEAKYTRFSFVRLISFVLGVLLLIYLWTIIQWYTIPLVFLFLLAFARLVQWHLSLQRQRNHHEALVKINKWELSFLKGDYSVFHPGKEFVDPEHPYSVDLDLFGDYSFFQYINRCSTTTGHHRLAEHLKHPANPDEIRLRQEAIRELQNSLDWRQDFQAHGMQTADSIEHLENLKLWLADPPFMMPNKGLKWSLYIIPFIATLGVYLWIFYVSWPVAILFFLPSLYILRKTVEKVNKAHIQTTHAEIILSNYARLIGHIETQDFQSPKLQKL